MAIDHQAIASLVVELEAERVVVGLPVSMNGGMGPAARAASAEAEVLATLLPVPVETYDERLTTVAADRLLLAGRVRGGARRRVVDKIAAAVILQGWLGGRAQMRPLLKVLLALFGLLALLGVGSGVWVVREVSASSPGGEVNLTIPIGASTQQIAAILDAKQHRAQRALLSLLRALQRRRSIQGRGLHVPPQSVVRRRVESPEEGSGDDIHPAHDSRRPDPEGGR